MVKRVLSSTYRVFTRSITRQERCDFPLQGYRFFLKDNLAKAGQQTVAGNPQVWGASRGRYVAARSATVVQLVETAGAHCMGRYAGDDSAFCLTGRNNRYPLDDKGQPQAFTNFHDQTRVPGGSTSGPLLALLEHQQQHGGEQLFALGTDTGGSGRIPPAYNGLWGLRPTYGRISLAGVIPNVPSCDTVCIISSSADVIGNVASVLLADNLPKKHVVAIKRFIIPIDLLDHCSSYVLDFFKHAVSLIKKQFPRAEVKELTLKQLSPRFANVEEWASVALSYMFSEVAAELGGDVLAHGEEAFSPSVWSNFQMALSIKPEQIATTQRQFIQARRVLRSFLSEDSYVLLPTTPTIAPKIDGGEKAIAELQSTFLLTFWASMSGQPQVTVPLGHCLSQEGNTLPLGLSLIGALDSDLKLVKLAAQIERCLTSPILVRQKSPSTHEALNILSPGEGRLR